MCEFCSMLNADGSIESSDAEKLVDALFESAAHEAGRRLAASDVLELDGKGARRLREAFADAMEKNEDAGKPFRCEHIGIPQPVTGRAARPGFLRCGECADAELDEHGEGMEDTNKIACDLCGKTGGDTIRAVVLAGYIFILTSACQACALIELMDEGERLFAAKAKAAREMAAKPTPEPTADDAGDPLRTLLAMIGKAAETAASKTGGKN